MKKCTKCEIEKPLGEFYKRRDSRAGRVKDTLRSMCKICWRQDRDEWKRQNLHKTASYAAKYVSLVRNDPMHKAQRMLHSARSRCKGSGRAFQLTAADITPFPEMCPVLNIPLVLHGAHRFDPASLSLDRIDNKKGYTIGNVKVISNRANKLKGDGTLGEFRAIVKYMESHQQQ